MIITTRTTIPRRTPLLLIVVLLFAMVQPTHADWAGWEPTWPTPGDSITISYDLADRGTLPSGPVWLHWGINGWQAPPPSLWPDGTVPAGDAAVRSPMQPDGDGLWTVTFPTLATTTAIDFLFTDNAGNWDNHFLLGWHLEPGNATPAPLLLTTDHETVQDTTTLWCEQIPPVDSMTLQHLWTDGSQNVTLDPQQGVFAVPVTLRPGDNQFVLSAEHDGFTGTSDTLTVVQHVPQAPVAIRSATISGSTVHLFAGQSYDPQDQPLQFQWTVDPANPAPTPLAGSNTAHATCATPSAPGAYRYHLRLDDPDGNITHAQLLIEVDQSCTADPVDLDEAAGWIRDAVVYEIFPRYHHPSGQLNAITADLPRLVTLGVNCLWIMPIFEAPPWNSYAIADYYAVEQDVGTMDDYRALMDAAHALGIRVLLDIPINHTGIWHPWFMDAAEKGTISPTWDWYDRDENGDYTYYNDWDSLPNLNYDNPDVRRYMIEMCQWWLEEAYVDGFRADVAWGVHERRPDFWADWRVALKTRKPDLFLQGEASVMDFSILTDRFDSVMDWPLYFDPGGFRLLFNGSSASQVHGRITNQGDYFPAESFPFRFIENHDETRYISEHTPEQTRTAATMLLTIPGVPMLYAGQEIGATLMRGPINWEHDPHNLFDHYARLVDARRRLPALRSNFVRQLSNSAGETVYSYLRHAPGLPAAVVALNLSQQAVAPDVILPASVWIEPDSQYVVTDVLSGQHTTQSGDQLLSLRVPLGANEGRVLVIDREPFLPDDLTLSLVPVTTAIPPSGGDVVFDGIVINRSNSPLTRTAWIRIEKPDGTVTAPLLQRQVTLPPGTRTFSGLALPIPSGAQPGSYRLHTFIGHGDPVVIDATDSIEFVKYGSVAE